jgi:hypothetical protein
LAAYLERLAGDDTARFVDLLAYHYDHSENLPKKREYLRRAGKVAAARFANDAALDYLSRALALTLEDAFAARYDLLLAREQVYQLQAAREAQTQDIAALEALAERMDDDRRRTEVALCRARFATATSVYPEALAAAAQAVAWAAAAGDVGLVVEIELYWSEALMYAGQDSAAHPRLRRVLEMARTAHRADLQMYALLGLGSAATSYYADFSTAFTLERQALALARSCGHRQGECYVLVVLGDTMKRMGLYHDAHAMFEQCLMLTRTIGDRRMETYTLQNLATLAAIEGAYDRALDYAAQTDVLAQAIGAHPQRALALTSAGHGLAGLRHWEAAADAYRQSCDLFHAFGRSDAAAEPVAGLARIELAQGNTAQALAQVEPLLVQIESLCVLSAEEPLRIDLTCCQVLRARNDPRADATLERTHTRLQEQAAKIVDAEMRRVFLEHVPSHREIVATWKEHHSS